MVSICLLCIDTNPKNPPKELKEGELRINPVINQLKFDLNGYYYKRESGNGGYYKLYPK